MLYKNVVVLFLLMQMILLYKDPKGISVNSIETVETTQNGTQINVGLENKIVILENTVLELKNKIEILKV